MNLLLICSLPIAAFMAGGAFSIIGFLYHRTDFLNSVPVVQALAPGLVFLYINTLFSSIIVSTKGEKKIPLMAAAALVFNLGLNLWLIPHFEQIAAAAVTSLTELLLLCISAVFMPRYLLPRKSLPVAIKTLLASLLMGAVIFYLQRLSIFLLLPLGALVYISLTTLLRTVPSEDMQSLFKAIKGKGERSSVETLTSIVEENIYTQITDPRLPAVKVTRALAETRMDYGYDEDETTLRLPPIDQRTTRPYPSISEATTLPLSVVQKKYRKAPAATAVEKNDEDDETTLRLPSPKARSGSRKPTLQIEGP